MTSARRFEDRTLLAVFAHPDDESLACGGLLALGAEQGVRVALHCLTRGEHGPGGEASVELAGTRARELEAAARVLGVADLTLGELPDGMLPWLDEGVLESEIHETLMRVGPDVVVTFDEDGLYWHPDHIAVHEAVTAVVHSLRDAGPALYYVTMPPGQMRALSDTLAARAPGSAPPRLFGIDNVDAFGDGAHAPTLVVDVSAHAPIKLAALRCHESQVAGSLDSLTDADAKVLLGIEHYRRAAVAAHGPTFLEDLGVRNATTAAVIDRREGRA
jgi:LmbE family N-acetylglucosaminyl deacetylase